MRNRDITEERFKEALLELHDITPLPESLLPPTMEDLYESSHIQQLLNAYWDLRASHGDMNRNEEFSRGS